MNKHLKIAIFVAPILIVLGYIASDFYIESKAEVNKVFMLNPMGACNLFLEECVLSSGDFKVNVFDKDGNTTINSTFPLDSVNLFIVNSKEEITQYTILSAQTKHYWHVKTPLRKNYEETKQPQKLRLIVKIKGSQYIAEFLSIIKAK